MGRIGALESLEAVGAHVLGVVATGAKGASDASAYTYAAHSTTSRRGLRRLFSRSGPKPAVATVTGEPVVHVGDRTVDLSNRRVTGADGTDVRLTPTEWHLLEVLVRNPGKLLSQAHLLSEVWGPGYENAQGN